MTHCMPQQESEILRQCIMRWLAVVCRYDAGCQNLTNIDFSKICIREMMTKNLRHRPHMKWLVMDMTSTKVSPCFNEPCSLLVVPPCAEVIPLASSCCSQHTKLLKCLLQLLKRKFEQLQSLFCISDYP